MNFCDLRKGKGILNLRHWILLILLSAALSGCTGRLMTRQGQQQHSLHAQQVLPHPGDTAAIALQELPQAHEKNTSAGMADPGAAVHTAKAQPKAGSKADIPGHKAPGLAKTGRKAIPYLQHKVQVKSATAVTLAIPQWAWIILGAGVVLVLLCFFLLFVLPNVSLGLFLIIFILIILGALLTVIGMVSVIFTALFN